MEGFFDAFICRAPVPGVEVESVERHFMICLGKGWKMKIKVRIVIWKVARINSRLLVF